jgi:hypothetical protein
MPRPRRNSQFRRAQRRFDQAMLRAFPVRQGAQVTVTTATFSAIGQPQRITAPPHAVPIAPSAADAERTGLTGFRAHLRDPTVR